MKRMMLLVVVLGVCGLASNTQAQDDRPQRPAMQPEREVDPARLDALIERRLEQVERQHQRLREIKQRLADGESPAAIFAELRERGEFALLGEWDRGGDREPQRAQRSARDGAEQRRLEDVSEEEFVLWRNKVMAFFEKHAPEMAERLRAEANTEQARRAVARLHREVERLIELREQASDEFSPALERLRNGMRIADVLGRVRGQAAAGTLTPELLSKLREELTEVVALQYDAQLEQRAKWLDRMGQRLAGAAEKLERERTERTQRIDAEVQAMLDRATNPSAGREPPAEGRPSVGSRRGQR